MRDARRPVVNLPQRACPVSGAGWESQRSQMSRVAGGRHMWHSLVHFAAPAHGSFHNTKEFTRTGETHPHDPAQAHDQPAARSDND
jgi:hypothetical protein